MLNQLRRSDLSPPNLALQPQLPMYLHTKINASEKAKPNLTTLAQLSGRGLDEKMFQGIHILFVQQSPGLELSNVKFITVLNGLELGVACLRVCGKKKFITFIFLYTVEIMQRHKLMVPASMLCNTIYLKMENAQI